VHKLFKSFADARPIAYPRVMEVFDPHFEGVKPFFDQVSLRIVDLISQS